ncbi:MAG: peptide ABC transporter substrate-binding protein [Verrucomicrobia bacterium]|nr:peptide ABC transporter substrate-binding protein [Verrucomicrobiota bacterium]
MQETLKKSDPFSRKMEFHSLLPKAISRFPLIFDNRLSEGLERFAVNASSQFLKERSHRHIRKILLTQFFLQKRIEDTLHKEDPPQKHLFLKLFSAQSRVCLAMTYSSSYGFQKEQLLKALQALMPSIREIPRSFYLWYNCDFSYYFCYLEIHKLRGQEYSKRELKKLSKLLQNQLFATPPLTPALFWPYNKEESIRQIQLLQREMNTSNDLPHISVHFREQTPTFLEFLIHFARPKSTEPLDKALKRLPDSLPCYCQFRHENRTPFEIEMGAFSIKVPSDAFEVHDSINLLYARRYVLKNVEEIIGPFRDYNGGLFEKQQEHFESIRFHLRDKILLFDLFAEKFFYALNRIEKWISLSMEEAEYLFSAFSELIQEKTSAPIKRHLKSFTIIKTPNSSDLPKHLTAESASHAHFMIGEYYYLCLLEPKAPQLEKASQKKTLRLIMEEGTPPSLNPQYSAGDIRSRILCKLLFEGLTRLNEQGVPELAGAAEGIKEGSLFTFKLRPYRWSNGEKVTAVDYLASWQNSISEYPELFYGIKNARLFKEKKCDFKEVGMRALDLETIQIELDHPAPRFLYKLSQPYFFPLFGSLKEPKWFNGPYLVRHQDRGGILLEKNPYFWNADRLYFDRIECKWINDPETIFSLFRSGEIDWCGDPLNILSTDQIRQLYDQKRLNKLKVKRRFFLYFNTRHPILSSPLIRRALGLAIDRSYIASHIVHYSTPVGPAHPQIEEAKALFRLAVEKFGSIPPLTFHYFHHHRSEKLAAYLKHIWQETFDLQIQLEGFEWDQFRSNLEKNNFEISGTIQETTQEDSFDYLDRFEGANSWNFSQWKHEPYRELLQTNQREAAKTLLNEESPIAPLFDYVHLYAQNPQLKRCFFDPEGCIDFSWAYLQD